MRHLIVVGLVVLAIAAGCSQSGSSAVQTPNVDATVEARVQATMTASTKSKPTLPETQPSQVVASTPTSKSPTATAEPTDQQKIAQVLHVAVTSMSQVPTNVNAGRYSDYIAFEMEYENKGEKAIRAFTGVVTFSDLFDRPIKKLQLTYDSPIAPGQKVIDKEKSFKVNQFMDDDKKLYDSMLENLHITFIGQSLIFEDGSRLGKVTP